MKIKNLKIYNKNKIKKSYILLTLIIGINIFSTSCYKEEKPKVTIPTIIIETTTELPKYNFNEALNDINKSETSFVEVSIDIKSYEQFSKNLSIIKNDYVNNDFFQIDNALNRYYASKSEEKYFFDKFIGEDKKISVMELYNIVKANNDKYLEEKKNIIGGTLYKKLDDKTLKKICTIITEIVNNYLNNDFPINFNIISSNLENLKIFQDASVSNAYVSDDIALVISPNMIEILEIMNNNKNAFYETIVHETMHLMQISNNQVRSSEVDINMGNAYSWQDLSVNPLFFKWFIEASAETEKCNYTNTDELVYSSMINYLQSITFASLIDSDNDVNDLVESTFDRNLEPIFNYFNCQTIENQKEIINMMYAIEIIQMEPKDFFEAYEKEYKKVLKAEELASLKKNLKPSICLTLSKLFYDNLAKQMVNQQIKIQDIFYLISVFEADLNSHLHYDSEDYNIYNKYFFEEYIKIQNDFSVMISNNNNYDLSKLEEDFNEYTTNIKDNENNIKNNYSLEWIDSNKREYITKLEEELKYFSSGSVRNYYEVHLNNSNVLQKKKGSFTEPF